MRYQERHGYIPVLSKLWRRAMQKRKSETSAHTSGGIVEENKEVSGAPAQVAIRDLHEA